MTQSRLTDRIDVELPSTPFVDEYKYRIAQAPSILLAVRRDVVGDLLLRNTKDSAANTQKLNGTIRAKSNPEKFSTKERLRGLKTLRRLDDTSDHDLIAEAYSHNDYPSDFWDCINLDSLTYGISATDGDVFSIRSRVFVEDLISVGEYQLADRETRNAVYESGTMQEISPENDYEKVDNSTALYEHAPVKQGNKFIQFVRLEAGTPEMLLYLLHTLLSTDEYGARATRHGRNVSNTIIGLALSDSPFMLSNGELLMKYDPEPTKDAIGTAVAKYMDDTKTAYTELYGRESVTSLDGVDIDPLPDWFGTLIDIATRQRDDADEIMADAFAYQSDMVNLDI